MDKKFDESPALTIDIVEDAIVAELGYHASYRRVFKTAGNLALVLGVSSPMSAILIIASYMIIYAGRWGLTWGWIIPCFIFFPQALAVAELCSAMPTNGTFYWWTAALAPPSLSRPLSYISGWLNIFTIVTTTASFSFALGSSWSAVGAILNPSWKPTNAQIMGIAMGLVILWLLLSCLKMENMTWFLIGIATLTVLTTAVFIIGVPVSHAVQHQPFTSAHAALAEYENFSEWGRAVALPMSFFAQAWVITGWSSPANVVEGTHNGSVVAPRAIVVSFVLMSFMGAFICWISAFCIPDIAAAAMDPSGFPLYTMLLDHWGTKAGSAFLIIVYVCISTGGAAFVYSSSCVLAAFARDNGTPFATTLAYVQPYLNIPIYSTCTLVGGTLLILLFGLSPEASAIIYSLAIIASLMNYGLPISLRLLYKERFVQGPWNYGKYSFAIHVWADLSVIWLIIMESFPTHPRVSAATFNYNWVVSLGAIIIAVILWFSVGQRSFKGIDREALARFHASGRA